MSKIRRIFIITASFAALVVSGLLLVPMLKDAWWPEAAFARVTGYPLPAGMRVVKHESHLCDNLFRSCYFWLLEGPPHVTFPVQLSPGGRNDWNDHFDDQTGYLWEALQVLDPDTHPEEVPGACKCPRDSGGSHYLFRHKNGIRYYYLVMTL